MERELLSRVRPLIFTQDNKAYTRNGSILRGYSLELPEVFSLDEKDYESIHSMWYRALRDLPPGVMVHKMDIYLQGRFFFPEKRSQSYLEKATIAHFSGREKITHQSLLFFILPNSATLGSSRLQNPFHTPRKTHEAMEAFEQSRDFFSQDVKKAIDFINSSRYVKASALTQDELLYLEMAYFNGFYEDRRTDFDLKNARVGDKHMGVFSISNIAQLGETLRTSIEDASMSDRSWIYHQGFMDSLAIKLSCDHIYNQVIYIRDHQREKKRIEKQKDEFFGSRRFAREYQKDAQHLDAYLDEMADDEKIRLVMAHNNLVFYGGDSRQFEALSTRIPTLFKGVDITPYYPTGANRSNLLANSFPGFISNLDADNFFGPLDIRQALCLFTNVTSYRDDREGIYFNERLCNVPVRKDIWDAEKKRIKARNFFIIAPTGEGKSVLFNHIARQLLEEGTSVVIIDLGGSYRKLSLLYPDQTEYIRYREGESIGLNPFEIERPEDITTEKIEELSMFVFKLWKKERMPDDRESVALKKIISTYYKNVPSGHSFPDFYDFVDQYRDTLHKKLELAQMLNLEDFLHICSEFTREGLYSFLFRTSGKGLGQISGKRLIVFELDEVRENPLLLTIMLHLISETIRRVIWADRSRRGVVFFDEFAKMLQFPSVLSSTAYFYQTIRKYEGAVGVVIQSPAQLPDSEISNAIIDNTQVMYILPNTKGYEQVIRRFGMPHHYQVQLQSLRNNFSAEHPYSEFMLVLGAEANVYRLEIPREVFLAYQSEGKQYEEIMALYEKTASMELAIEHYMGR